MVDFKCLTLHYIIVRATLVGIVSYGAADCAHEQFPGVYSRVSAVMPWIENIAEGSLHSSCDDAYIPPGDNIAQKCP